MKSLKSLYSFWLLGVLIVISIIFGILDRSFFQVRNLLNILSSACLSAIAGIGLTCIMSSGEIDFASGTEITLGAASMAYLATAVGIKNYFITLCITLVLLIAFGMLNAFIHIKIGIPAFIATMGTSYVLQGFIKSATQGRNIFGVASNENTVFTWLGQGYMFGLIPMPAVCLIIISIITIIYTEKTRSGKYLYAVGANSTACKYLGIDANVQKLKGFVLCSVLCGFAGIVQGSMLNGCSIANGSTMLISGLTVLMLGATFYKIGVYNIPGTIVAALLISILSNGMTLLNASAALKNFVNAGTLMIGVTLVSIIRKKNARV